MAKRVFFSFHYQDVIDFRANVVRNHWMTKKNRETAGFYDSSIWEEAKKTGSIALKRLINKSIKGTSSTCVLVGSDTYLRPWVRYEIMRSFKKGNSICAVHINSIKGKNRKTKPLGENPLEYLKVSFSDSGLTATLYEWKSSRWKKYTELDSRASYQYDKPVPKKYRGSSFELSDIYSIYDWDKDNGYSNFSDWV